MFYLTKDDPVLPQETKYKRNHTSASQKQKFLEQSELPLHLPFPTCTFFRPSPPTIIEEKTQAPKVTESFIATSNKETVQYTEFITVIILLRGLGGFLVDFGLCLLLVPLSWKASVDLLFLLIPCYIHQ